MMIIKTHVFKNDEEFVEFQRGNPTLKIHTVMPLTVRDSAIGTNMAEGKVDVVHKIEHNLFVTTLEEEINPLISVVGKIHNEKYSEAISALEKIIMDER